MFADRKVIPTSPKALLMCLTQPPHPVSKVTSGAESWFDNGQLKLESLNPYWNAFIFRHSYEVIILTSVVLGISSLSTSFIISPNLTASCVIHFTKIWSFAQDRVENHIFNQPRTEKSR